MNATTCRNLIEHLTFYAGESAPQMGQTEIQRKLAGLEKAFLAAKGLPESSYLSESSRATAEGLLRVLAEEIAMLESFAGKRKDGRLSATQPQSQNRTWHRKRTMTS
jgi:hypothetical protein